MSKYGITLPLRITRHENSLGITDSQGIIAAYVYFEPEKTRRQVAKLLSPEHAEEVAKLFAQTLSLAVQREGEEG